MDATARVDSARGGARSRSGAGFEECKLSATLSEAGPGCGKKTKTGQNRNMDMFLSRCAPRVCAMFREIRHREPDKLCPGEGFLSRSSLGREGWKKNPD